MRGVLRAGACGGFSTRATLACVRLLSFCLVSNVIGPVAAGGKFVEADGGGDEGETGVDFVGDSCIRGEVGEGR